MSVVDHLVYAVSSLDDGIRALADQLGVSAAPGGQHAAWRTQNALLSLGPRTYLEVMGPCAPPGGALEPRPFGIDEGRPPRLASWAASSPDLEKTAAIARSEGVDLGNVQPGERRKPDGSVLRWRMTDLRKVREQGIVPFFIHWGDTPHPGGTAPKGCILEKLELFHPDARRIERLLEKLGLDVPVHPGATAIRATIMTPKGRVVLE